MANRKKSAPDKCTCSCSCGARPANADTPKLIKSATIGRLQISAGAFDRLPNGHLSNVELRSALAEGYEKGLLLRMADHNLDSDALSIEDRLAFRGMRSFYDRALSDRRSLPEWVHKLRWLYFASARWPEKADWSVMAELPPISSLNTVIRPDLVRYQVPEFR